MNALEHQDAQVLFSAYVDHELPEAELERLVAHLDGCSECQGGLEKFERAVGAVRGMERVRAPARFSRQVMRRVRHRNRRLAAVRPFLDGSFRPPVEIALPIIVVAAVAALLVHILR